jgi:t-SNARE complex subunit (syntaxin)
MPCSIDLHFLNVICTVLKDLAHLVEGQQEDIDNVESHVENSNAQAKQGVEQLEKANNKPETGCLIS